MKFTKIIFPLVAILLLITYACQKESSVVFEKQTENERILAYLSQNSFKPTQVDFKDDFVLIDGDAGWFRKDLMQMMERNESIQFRDLDVIHSEDDHDKVNFRQRGIIDANYLEAVTASKVNSINYFIRPSVETDSGKDWINAINNAATDWNNVSDCRVKLTRVYTQSSANLVFGSDADTGMPSSHQNLSEGDNTTTYALAGYPSNGTIFKWVSINNNQITKALTNKKQVIMHEIGHCLGYRHNDGFDGYTIPGTPRATDFSIMNRGFNLPTSFSTIDLLTFRMYYPESLSTPGSYSVSKASTGVYSLTFKNPSYPTKPYYWVQINIYNSADVLVRTDYATVAAETVTINAPSSLTSGTYRIAIRGQNLRRDVSSTLTSKLQVKL